MSVPAADPTLDTTTLIGSAIVRAGQLATLPEVALEVMRVAENPQATGEELNRVLSKDPALTARVLRIVNSAYYGVRREVTSISTAIALLGFGAVKSIAIAASLTRMFRGGAVGPSFEARELWRHSIAVAAAARLLASQVEQVEPSEAFLAGLVHDIGIIVELQACREAFAAVIGSVSADPSLSFRLAEEQHVGANHEAFGEALCTAWRFPAALRRVTGYHHRPLELAQPICQLTAVVHIADHLAASMSLGYARTVEQGGVDPAVGEVVGLTESDLERICTKLQMEVAEVFPMLNGDG